MMGDCGDVVASLWPTVIGPRRVLEGSRLLPDSDCWYKDQGLVALGDPAAYTATAKGTA